MRELYAEYRAFAMPKGQPRYPDVEDELKLLQRYAPLYETLEGRKFVDKSLSWFGRKMAAWQVTTVYPVSMQLGDPAVDEVTREKLIRLLYSYIVRRALCGLTTKNLNNTFYGLAAKFQQSGVSREVFQDYFLGRDGDSIRFPDDLELESSILTINAYDISPQPRLADILWELEGASRSTFAEHEKRPDDLWIEHVLPKSWTDEWPYLGSEYAAPDSNLPHARLRGAAIHTLGNLTLITSSLNISAGNRSFKAKKDKFAEHTGLFLNKWFAKREQWMEAEIEERGRHLAGLAMTIWPSLQA